MLILALDLATRTGWVMGEADAPPPDLTISGWRLRRTGQGPEVAAANLACYLRDLFSVSGVPDLICVEAFMRPEAMMSADAAILAIALHFVVQGIAGAYGVRVESVTAQTIRVHFCGRASANPPRKKGQPRRTSREAAADREATKNMVWKRAVALGYFPRAEAPDYDRSDASAVFDYAAATYARATRPFALHGQVL
jgi:hypothetical protein